MSNLPAPIEPQTGDAIAPGTGVLRPVATAQEILDAWKAYQALKRQLLTPDDYQEIQGRPRVKKSGWRKIATAFGISTAIVREQRRTTDTGAFHWETVVRAIAPNGRYCEAVGSCASDERKFAHPDHDVRAVAQTRATNRAISDLVGGGEVSAEELTSSTRQGAAKSAPAF
jgi:hypothetical protein